MKMQMTKLFALAVMLMCAFTVFTKPAKAGLEYVQSCTQMCVAASCGSTNDTCVTLSENNSACHCTLTTLGDNTKTFSRIVEF